MACKRHEQLADLKGKGRLIQSGLFLPGEAGIGTVILDDQEAKGVFSTDIKDQ
jgi:uncharacterized protein YciI